MHGWLTHEKHVEYKLGGRAINEGVAQDLSAQIARIASTSYIHSSDVEKLRKAIDAMEAKK